MSQIISKFIADGAVIASKLDATAKQSVLESKLVGARRGVLGFSTTASSSDTVTSEVQAAAAVDTPQTDLVTGEGIFVGTVANSVDSKKVLIRQAGTDQGVDDGSGDEVFGKLSESAGVFTLSYFKADNTAFTFSGATSIDFYFVEVQDLHSLNSEALLRQAVSGVIDADQAATLSGHLDGAASKHDASEIDFELVDGSKKVVQAASDDVESALTDLDSALGDVITLSGVAQNSLNLGLFSGTTIADNQTIKAALQDLETALEEIDANVDDLITLSGVAENSVNLGTFTGATIADNQTVKAALQDLETSLEEIDANVNDLITLSGVAENAVNLGTFTGTTITDNATIKSALQELETAVEAASSQTDACESFVLSGTDITNGYVDLAQVPDDETCVQLHVIGGPLQDHSVDFDIISDGSENKRLSWSGLGLDGVLESGDKLRVYYQVA